MKQGIACLILLASLAACHRRVPAPPSSGIEAALGAEEKIVRATLALLVSDGKPVCVEPETFGSPLAVWHVATSGKLQQAYDLAWSAPKPFRPPAQPTVDELRNALQAGQPASLIEPRQRRDHLPAAAQAALQAQASTLVAPDVPTHRVVIGPAWVPRGIVTRWWPGGSKDNGCGAQYVLSGVKRDAHVAFVSVRAQHWGTVFALAPDGDDWRPIAQWGTWLY